MVNYCILAHNNPDQLKKLINAIHEPGYSRVIIHLDAKSDKSTFDASVKDVWFTQKRISVEWGTFSVVEAVIECLDFVSEQFFDGYVLFISGQDFPIRRKKEIFHFLDEHRNEIFLKHEPFPTSKLPGGGLNRLDRQWYSMGHRGNLISFKSRSLSVENFVNFYRLIRYRPSLLTKAIKLFFTPPHWPEKTFYYCEMWWGAPYKAMKDLINYIHNHPKILDFYRTMRVPDETCLQTIFLNHIFPNSGLKLNNELLTYIEWSSYRWPRPTIFRSEDLWSLEKIKIYPNYLFARKFDENVDPRIFDLLQQKLLN